MIEIKDEKAWKWLSENELSYKIWNNKYRYNNESFDDWLDRVSGKNEKVKKLIFEKKFLFGGRTLTNRGTNNGSLNNCYSIGFVPDSLTGILDVNSKIALTYKAQGGQGLSLSHIRPKGTPIKNNFTSDGIIPFMEMFNTTTSSISQGGSRKGALMMSLDVWHKEIEDFIKIKNDLNKINKANLSVEIDDAFMDAVEHKINSDIKVSRIYAGHNIEYTINPVSIFDLICESARKSAEPGIIFTDRFRNYNLMEFVDTYNIETCNPCGEQPLPKHGACGLCSINLSEYVLNPFTEEAEIDYKSLAEDLSTIVIAMDDIVTENLPNHALKEQKEVAEKYRNIGIGIMGWHDLLIKFGYIYGSDQSIVLAQTLSNFIFRNAVMASAELAKQRGNFPGYDPKIWDSNIIKYNFHKEEIEKLKKNNCLRNCALLSIAPTGSIGTLLNISTGVEPWFSVSYTRRTESLDGKESFYEVVAPVVKEAQLKNWHPEAIVTANDISWKNHILMQSVWQNSIDTAISKTINMPKTTTVQDVKDLYLFAWKKGCKGITIYVDGSRDAVLSTESKKEEIKQEKETCLNCITPISRKKMGVTSGCTFCKKCACGTLYVTTNCDSEGNLVEIFTHTSKGGICQANLNAETRMASLALRAGVRVDEVIDQLKGITCPACTAVKARGGKLDGISCPDIIAKTILEFQKHDIVPKVTDSKIVETNNTSKQEYEECPECHAKTLIREGGCRQCTSCGYSKCE